MRFQISVLASVLVFCLPVISRAKCTYSLSPTSASYPAAGGSGSFIINTTAVCSWTAATTNSWIHTTSSGFGTNIISYSVDPSGGTTSRSGTITAGGQTFTISQAGVAPTLAFALNNSNLVWQTASDYPWFGTNDVSHDGVASATSSNRYVPNSTSWIQTTVIGPGTIGFWWKVDSDVTPPPPDDPLSFDDLEFLINGVQQDQIMGQIDWNYREFPVPAGSNTLTWQYVKDGQFNTGYDRAWLDQVTWSPGAPISLPEALDTCGVQWSSDGTIPTTWTGETNLTHDGKSAARSGTIYLNQETWMQAVVTGVSNVSFWWKVSSQTNYDFLEFYTNDILARRISGEVNWQSNFFKLSTNAVSLKWRYAMTNGIYAAQGQDAAWVDQVVLSPAASAAPIVTLLGSNPISLECHGNFTDPGATAQDGCSGAALVVGTNGLVNPNILGAYTIRYVSTNGSGSSTTNTRWVNVVDTTPPQIALNGANPMTVECHGVFVDPGATALDTCAGTLGVVTNGSVNASLPGSYTLQYVATDPSGNSATNTRSVNVVDTTPPEITLNGLNPMTVECHGVFVDPGATALDTCAGALGVVTNGSIDPSLPGSYSLQYIATDASGNSATNTRSVNVVDTTAPVIEYCFTNLTLTSSSGCSAVLPDLTDTNHILAMDNCSSVTITQSPPAGTVLGLGTNQLVLTVSDTAGNSTAVTNSIVVVDSTPPVLVCPPDVLVSADPGQCAATNVVLGAPNVTDNCAVGGVTNDAPASFPLGTNLVNWTAVDIHGNSATAVQQVIVYPAPRLAHSITRIVSGADGSITLSFTGAANGTFIVQASSNLLDWINLHTNIAGPDGSWTYTDSTAAGTATRFYRSAQP